MTIHETVISRLVTRIIIFTPDVELEFNHLI